MTHLNSDLSCYPSETAEDLEPGSLHDGGVYAFVADRPYSLSPAVLWLPIEPTPMSVHSRAGRSALAARLACSPSLSH